jgi:2-dehydro-3-deoxyphosphogluconate aldolase/(4S)-4-hydroxy-2-oxoglutarate aldolase
LLIKLFPAAPLGGPDYLRAILGPFPHALIMPSGGLATDAESLREWFAAGAACLSIGSNLFPPASLKADGKGAAGSAIAEVMEAIRRNRS